MRDYVYRQWRVDGPVHERELRGHVGGANRNSYLVAADEVAIYEFPKTWVRLKSSSSRILMLSKQRAYM